MFCVVSAEWLPSMDRGIFFGEDGLDFARSKSRVFESTWGDKPGDENFGLLCSILLLLDELPAILLLGCFSCAKFDTGESFL